MSDATAERVVIVGAGIAGVSAAGALRSAGHEGSVVLVGDEPELPYRRPPVSKEVVRGEKGPDDIRIRKAAWYEQQRIELRTGTHVTAVDVDARTVSLEDGEQLSWDRLLLATGGRARTLTSDVAAVRTLRRLDDVAPLAKDLTPGAGVLVVGAGLIGSEIAASARELGCDVTLLETADLPLPRLLPPEIGRRYLALHADRGTALHTGVRVTSIEDAPDGTGVVRAEDGRRWTADVVVVAVGMEPAVELALAAGLEVADAAAGGGIVVDGAGRTSVPDVFAAGDVALRPSPLLGRPQRVEHWQGAQNHGAAVGRAMAGEDVDFDEVPWCWSDQYGQTLQVAGWPEEGPDVVVRGSLESLDFTAFHLDGDGVLRGVVTIGRPTDVRAARAWIGARARPDRAVLADDGAALAEAVAP